MEWKHEEDVRNELVAAIAQARIYETDLRGMKVEEHLLQHQGWVISSALRPKGHAANHLQSAMIQADSTAPASRLYLTPHALAAYAVETIVTCIAAHRFDLLVVGLMDHSTICGHEWGSTFQPLTRLAHCAVVVSK